MRYKKSNDRQLKADMKPCMRCMRPTSMISWVVPGKLICTKCESELRAVLKKRSASRTINVQTNTGTNRNAVGSNQYRTRSKKRNQYQTKRPTQWLEIVLALILGILLYLMLSAIFSPTNDDKSLAPTAEAMTIISPLPTTGSLVATVSATPTPSVQQVVSGGEEAFLRRVHILESSAGKNTDPNALHNKCKAKSQSNEMGWGGMAMMHCFDSHDEALARVARWYKEKRAVMSEAMTYCYYAEGVKRSDCPYWLKAQTL